MTSDFHVNAKLAVRDFSKVTREAVDALAKGLEVLERADIAAAGMQRYAKKTRVRVRTRGEHGYDVQVYPRPNWMRAWEYGATSVGSPLLWIPAPGNIFGNIRAKKYPGKLIRLKGKNILINAVTRKIAFIGIPRTSIQASLHLRQIAEEEAARFIEIVMNVDA
jgi:hypothetical protein